MSRRTTVVLEAEDQRALRRASREEGVSQSELLRRGIRMVTAPYRGHRQPTVGWLRLSRAERSAIRRDAFGDPDE